VPFQSLHGGAVFGYSATGENALPCVKIEVPTSYTQTTSIARGQAVILNTSGQAVLAPVNATGRVTCIGVAAETVAASADNSALVPVVVFGQINLNTTTYVEGNWTGGNVIFPSLTTAGYLTSYTADATNVKTTASIIGTVITDTSTNSMLWINPR
jgi:hypothetical protein